MIPNKHSVLFYYSNKEDFFLLLYVSKSNCDVKACKKARTEY